MRRECACCAAPFSPHAITYRHTFHTLRVYASTCMHAGVLSRANGPLTAVLRPECRRLCKHRFCTCCTLDADRGEGGHSTHDHPLTHANTLTERRATCVTCVRVCGACECLQVPCSCRDLIVAVFDRALPAGASTCATCQEPFWAPAGATSCDGCQAGTYQEGSGETSTCTPCNTGTFSATPGATSFDTCLPCAAG